MAAELTVAEAAQRVLGLLESGDLETGLTLALALAEQCPDEMEILYVAGLACWQAGRHAEAIGFQRRLIACDPGNLEIRRNLVELFLRLDDQSGIIDAVDEAVEAGYEDPRMINAKGLAQYKLGDSAAALDTFRRVTELQADFAKAYQNMSVVLMDQGDGEAAVEVYAKSLAPWDGNLNDGAASEITSRYDERAETYDETELHRYFGRTMAAFILAFSRPEAQTRILDAACGTGAVGHYLPRFEGALVGIDISPAMLDKARSRGIYQELHVGDVVQVMCDLEGPFDMVTCCCALYHVADLTPFFEQASRLLVSGGYLFFSVDPATDEFDIAVSGEGEYAHSRKYLRGLAGRFDLDELEIRIMNHRMMPGFWVALQKS